MVLTSTINAKGVYYTVNRRIVYSTAVDSVEPVYPTVSLDANFLANTFACS